MKITTNLLKQLIREAMQDDLEFLRDVRYSGIDLESYIKIIKIYAIAAKNDDVVTMQYIDDIPGLPKHAHGRYFRTHEVNLVKRFLEDLDDNDPADFMGPVEQEDFAYFIRRAEQVGQKRFAMAALLWPLVHFVHNETKAEIYDGEAPYNLEPI